MVHFNWQDILQTFGFSLHLLITSKSDWHSLLNSILTKTIDYSKREDIYALHNSKFHPWYQKLLIPDSIQYYLLSNVGYTQKHLIIQLRLNKFFIRLHSKILYINDDHDCPFCHQAYSNLFHYFVECENLSTIRSKFNINFSNKLCVENFQVQLQDLSKTSVYNISNFIQSIFNLI